MFKNCLSKFSCALIALCALVTGGLFQSCTDVLDDYKYDDKEPSWLGSSIYDFLNDESGDRTYRNYVRIIEDLDLKDVLARTGSKTLFIADDAAFEKFFANNDWGVECYEDLTVAQKKVILYNAMLDNAYLLDMLSSRHNIGIKPRYSAFLHRRRYNSCRFPSPPEQQVLRPLPCSQRRQGYAHRIRSVRPHDGTLPPRVPLNKQHPRF